MAYHFDGTDDRVEFALAPLSGYTMGPVTFASLFRMTAATATANRPIGPLIVDSTDGSVHALTRSFTSSQVRITLSASVTDTSGFVFTAGTWTMLAVTWAGAGATPRLHHNTGSGWTHVNFPASIVSDRVIVASPADRLIVGRIAAVGPLLFDGDVVCAAIKKAAMSDGQIDALSLTSWAAWQAAGFDWLAGFETAGTVADSGTPGTGDEISRTGTTLVSDPAGWTWGGATPTLTSIAVTPADATIDTDDTQQYLATGTYSDSSTADITADVTWSSSNPAAATIDAAGLATAVGVGDTTIAADE